MKIEKYIKKLPLWQIVVVAAIVLVGAFIHIDTLESRSVVTPTLVVTDTDGVVHEIRGGSTLNPLSVTVAGVTNPESVLVKWNIRTTADKSVPVTVKFYYLREAFGNLLGLDTRDTGTNPVFASYVDSEGYFTQTVQSNTDDVLWVGGVTDWNWVVSSPDYTLEEILADEPPGEYRLRMRLIGYVEADGLRSDFEPLLGLTIIKTYDGITSLSVVVTPSTIV